MQKKKSNQARPISVNSMWPFGLGKTHLKNNSSRNFEKKSRDNSNRNSTGKNSNKYHMSVCETEEAHHINKVNPLNL